MSGHLEKLKKQLLEIADVVNTFESETVQIKVVEKLLLQLDTMNRKDNPGQHTDPALNTVKGILYPKQTKNSDKPPGLTRILHLLLKTDYFDTNRSISEITEYANEHFKGPFYTYSASGILLKLVKQGKLERVVDKENSLFKYIKPTVQ